MKIIVHGSTGVMGQKLIDCIRRGGVHTVAAEVAIDAPEYTALEQFSGEADMVIDFSNHVTTLPLMAYCVARRLPVVVCTTGQTEEEKACIRQAAEQIPVFSSGNMSVGIALLAELARQTAKLFPDADIEIVEKHHNRKLDAPSGTALMLADAIREVRPEATYQLGRAGHAKRTPNEIGIHALRYGNEIGTHEVIVATANQVITLTHESEDRALFADGAITAAEFLLKKAPGLYNMKDMMKEA